MLQVHLGCHAAWPDGAVAQPQCLCCMRRVSEMLEVIERAEQQDPQQAAAADQPGTSDSIVFEEVWPHMLPGPWCLLVQLADCRTELAAVRVLDCTLVDRDQHYTQCATGGCQDAIRAAAGDASQRGSAPRRQPAGHWAQRLRQERLGAHPLSHTAHMTCASSARGLVQSLCPRTSKLSCHSTQAL